MNSVSVVLPTIGRSTLAEVINSMLNESNLIKEIIVVDDSKNGIGSLLSRVDFTLANRVKVIRTSGLEGPSRARNIGLASVTGEMVAFTDDDDPWMADRIKSQLSFMREFDLQASLCTNHNGSRGTCWDGSVDPLIFLYEAKTFFRHERFLPFGSLLFKKEVYADIKFETKLKEREDLWFLHQMYVKNSNMRQSEFKGINVQRKILRSIRRPTIEDDLIWGEMLTTMHISLSINFLFYVALRNSLVSLNFLKSVRILQKLIHLGVKSK